MKPTSAPPAAAGPAITWIEPGQSPFGIRVLDLRQRVFGTTAWTTNENIAAHFATSRRSTGDHHAGKFPASVVSWDCNIVFRYSGEHQEGPVFKAPVMEDKWDMYVFADRLYAVRSWTDDLWFVAECSFGQDKVTITTLHADSTRAGDDKAYALRVIDYLVKSHMSNMVVPHPMPDSFRDKSIDEIAEHSFSLFGRRGLFASFDETLGVVGPHAGTTG